MTASIIGQDAMVERRLLGLVANGNLLVDGLPGFRLPCVTVSSSCLFPLSLRELCLKSRFCTRFIDFFYG
jgi:hypothetical protein